MLYGERHVAERAHGVVTEFHRDTKQEYTVWVPLPTPLMREGRFNLKMPLLERENYTADLSALRRGCYQLLSVPCLLFCFFSSLLSSQNEN